MNEGWRCAHDAYRSALLACELGVSWPKSFSERYKKEARILGELATPVNDK